MDMILLLTAEPTEKGVPAELVRFQMVAIVVHTSRFSSGRLKFLFCAGKIFANLDESSDHHITF
jgi:hypothetical protein